MVKKFTAADMEAHKYEFETVERAYLKGKRQGRQAVMELISDKFAQATADAATSHACCRRGDGCSAL